MEIHELEDDLWSLKFPIGMNPLCALQIVADQVLTDKRHVHHGFYRGIFNSIVYALRSSFPDKNFAGFESTSTRVFANALRRAQLAKRANQIPLQNIHLDVRHTTAPVPQEAHEDDETDTSQRIFTIWSQLVSLGMGYNKQGRLAVLFSAISKRLGVKHGASMYRAASHSSMKFSLLRWDLLEAILSDADKEYIDLFVPAELNEKSHDRIVSFTVEAARSDVVRALVENNIQDSEDCIAHVTHNPLVEAECCVTCAVELHAEIEQCLNLHRIVFQPHRTSNYYVKYCKFSLKKIVRHILLHAADVELEHATFRKVRQELCKRVTVPQVTFHHVCLIMWFDGWAAGKHSKANVTTVKVRLLDHTGTVLPQRITSPYRLLEYDGPESELPGYYQFLEDSLRELHNVTFMSCRHSNYRVRVDRVILLADNKAASLIIGTMGGGHFSCPFSPVSSKHYGISPFHINSQGKVRLQPADVRRDREAFRRTALQNRAALNLAKSVYGDHPPEESDTADSRRPYMPILGLLPTADSLVQSTFFVPPVMHCSHELMELLATAVGQFPTPADPILKRAFKNMACGSIIDRTIACSEQGRARMRLATFAKPTNIVSVPKPVQPFFIMATMLQAQYYSKFTVTDESVSLHKLASTLMTLFLTVIGLNVNESGDATMLGPGAARESGRVTTKTTKMHEVTAVLPEVYARLRIPLFYLLEEALERDFLDNKEAQAQMHRAKIISTVIYREQVQAVVTRLTNQRRTGHRDLNIPSPPRYRFINVHHCCKKAQAWKALAALRKGTWPGDLEPALSEIVPHYWASIDHFFDRHQLQMPPIIRGWQLFEVAQSGEATLDVCMCNSQLRIE